MLNTADFCPRSATDRPFVIAINQSTGDDLSCENPPRRDTLVLNLQNLDSTVAETLAEFFLLLEDKTKLSRTVLPLYLVVERGR
jgi:hypothetical protein